MQFLDLSESIFYEDVEVGNVYRYVRMHNARFKENSRFDEKYLSLTKGRVIRRMDEARRLIDDKQPSLQELYMSCDSNDYDTKINLFRDVKTLERRDSEWWRKTGYIAHELISDYGRSPMRVIISIVLLITAFAALFYCVGNRTIIDCLIGSCSSFFTIGISALSSDAVETKIFMIIEGAIGLILMSYFVVVLCERRKL